MHIGGEEEVIFMISYMGEQQDRRLKMRPSRMCENAVMHNGLCQCQKGFISYAFEVLISDLLRPI